VVTLTVWIPGKLENPLNGSLSRAHWTKKSRWARTRREAAQMHFLEALGTGKRSKRPDPKAPKLVTFRCYVGAEWDDDNLRAACKPVRDSLKDMKIIDDDRPSAGHTFTYEQEIRRGKDAKRGVEVCVQQHPIVVRLVNSDYVEED
jgi:hypothetical protein